MLTNEDTESGREKEEEALKEEREQQQSQHSWMGDNNNHNDTPNDDEWDAFDPTNWDDDDDVFSIEEAVEHAKVSKTNPANGRLEEEMEGWGTGKGKEEEEVEEEGRNEAARWNIEWDDDEGKNSTQQFDLRAEKGGKTLPTVAAPVQQLDDSWEAFDWGDDEDNAEDNDALVDSKED